MASRTLLHIHGVEATSFLQGLLTNDVERKLSSPGEAFFCHLLNNKGRTMFEAFVATPNKGSTLASTTEDGVGSYVLECHVDVMPKLMKHLKMHKLRSKVKIQSLADSHDVWWSSHGEIENGKKEAILCSFEDPRALTLGHRTFVTKGTASVLTCGNEEAVVGVEETEQSSVEATYNMLRILHGALEGTEVDGVIPLEANLDWLNGVVFDKGCYLGQELTARTHYRGLLRKRCFPVVLSVEKDENATPTVALEISPLQAQSIAYGTLPTEEREGVKYGESTPPTGTNILNNGTKRAGKILTDTTTTSGNVGIALLRLEHVTGVATKDDGDTNAVVEVPERLLTLPVETQDGATVVKPIRLV